MGVIHRVTEKGDFRIRNEHNSALRWTVYAFAVNSVDSVHSVGNYVRVNSDERIVRHLQARVWTEFDMSDIKLVSLLYYM